MNLPRAIGSGFHNFVNFHDRTPRSGYWYWILFIAVIGLVTSLLEQAPGTISPAAIIAGLFLLLPTIAVSVRRLHDIDRPGWWLFVAFTGIGIILLTVWACMPGTAGRNRFGPDPLSASPLRT